jgi:phage N-6-adenine-methyltransferase
VVNSGLFSSKNECWETPQELFEALDRIFHFALDAAASKDNAKCPKFYTKEDDAIRLAWEEPTFLNPPYGRGIGVWIEKAYTESLHGRTTVCLIPARTDTKWWQTCWKASCICFIPGRLKFGGSKNSAPFPSAIVVFGCDSHWKIQALRSIGHVVVNESEEDQKSD